MAKVVHNMTVRRQVATEIAASPVVTDEYFLFEFQVDNVLVVEYDRDGERTIRHWHSPASNMDQQTISAEGGAGVVEVPEGQK